MNEAQRSRVFEFQFSLSVALVLSCSVVSDSEKAMAPHSSTLAWKIPWTEEPGRLQSMGSWRVGHLLSDFTFTFHFHALEKEMATHSSVLAWRIPGTGEPGGLLSMGSHRVRHDWSDLAAAAEYLIVFEHIVIYFLFFNICIMNACCVQGTFVQCFKLIYNLLYHLIPRTNV